MDRTEANVLVCVTSQPACRRLICAGAEIAQQYGVPVKVVSVLPQGLVSAKPLKPCRRFTTFQASSALR